MKTVDFKIDREEWDEFSRSLTRYWSPVLAVAGMKVEFHQQPDAAGDYVVTVSRKGS